MNMELRLLNACQLSDGAGESPEGESKVEAESFDEKYFREREEADIENWRRRQASRGSQFIFDYLQRVQDSRGLKNMHPAKQAPPSTKENSFATAFREDGQSLLDLVVEQRASLSAGKKLLCLVTDNERAGELASGLRALEAKENSDVQGNDKCGEKKYSLYHLLPSNMSIRVVVRLLQDLNDALSELSEAESLYCRQIEVNEGRFFVSEYELSLMKSRYEELLTSLGVTPGLFSLARQKAASEKEDCVRFLRKNRDPLPASAKLALAEANIVIAEPYDFLRFKDMHSYLKDYEIVLLDGAGNLSLRYVQLFMHIASEAFIYRVGEIVEPKTGVKGTNAFYDAQFARHINWLTGLVKEPTVLEEARGTSETYSEKTFWNRFYADLREARSEVVIISPFCWPRRMERLRATFVKLLSRGVKVRVYISDKPRGDEDLESVLAELRGIGLEPEVVPGLHIKMAFIDGKIAWEGSLNILSFNDSIERMRRFQGEAMVRESLARLDFGV